MYDKTVSYYLQIIFRRIFWQLYTKTYKVKYHRQRYFVFIICFIWKKTVKSVMIKD